MPTPNAGQEKKYLLIPFTLLFFNGAVGATLGTLGAISSRLAMAPLVLGAVGVVAGAGIGWWTMQRMIAQDPAYEPRPAGQDSSQALAVISTSASSGVSRKLEAPKPAPESQSDLATPSSARIGTPTLESMLSEGSPPSPALTSLTVEPALTASTPKRPNRKTNPALTAIKAPSASISAGRAKVNHTLLGMPTPSAPTQPQATPTPGGDEATSEKKEHAPKATDLLTSRGMQAVSDADLAHALKARRERGKRGGALVDFDDLPQPKAPSSDPLPDHFHEMLAPQKPDDNLLSEFFSQDDDLIDLNGLSSDLPRSRRDISFSDLPHPEGSPSFDDLLSPSSLQRDENPSSPRMPGASVSGDLPIVSGGSEPIEPKKPRRNTEQNIPRLRVPEEMGSFQESASARSLPPRSPLEEAVIRGRSTLSSLSEEDDLPAPEERKSKTSPGFSPKKPARVSSGAAAHPFAAKPRSEPETKPRVRAPSSDEASLSPSHNAQTRNQWARLDSGTFAGQKKSGRELSGLISFGRQQHTPFSSPVDEDSALLPTGKMKQQAKVEDSREDSALLPMGKMRQQIANAEASKSQRDPEKSALLPTGKMQQHGTTPHRGSARRSTEIGFSESPRGTRKGLLTPGHGEAAAHSKPLASISPRGQTPSRPPRALRSATKEPASQGHRSSEDKSIQQLFDDYTGALSMCGKSTNKLNIKAFSEYIHRERQKVRQRYKTNRVDMFVRIKKGKPRIVIRPLKPE